MNTTNRSESSDRSILIIEDDAAIAEVLDYNLTREGYKIQCCSDGVEGLRRAREWAPDLVILDLMLPSMNGIDICRELRSDRPTRRLGILMLTAKSDETDELTGFSVGADDYVTKPFSVKVLLQRVRVLLERKRPHADEVDVLKMHGVTLDRFSHQVHLDGELLALTPTEFRLLETLMRQPGRAFSRASLLRSAIGADLIVLERTIDVHIKSLRQKLQDRAAVIETVRGVGYRFARERSSP